MNESDTLNLFFGKYDSNNVCLFDVIMLWKDWISDIEENYQLPWGEKDNKEGSAKRKLGLKIAVIPTITKSGVLRRLTK